MIKVCLDMSSGLFLLFFICNRLLCSDFALDKYLHQVYLILLLYASMLDQDRHQRCQRVILPPSFTGNPAQLDVLAASRCSCQVIGEVSFVFWGISKLIRTLHLVHHCHPHLGKEASTDQSKIHISLLLVQMAIQFSTISSHIA